MQWHSARWLNRLVLAFLAAGGGFSAARAETPPATEEPVQHACPARPQVVIQGAGALDAAAVCEGVDRALTFLARAGLSAPSRTVIEVVPSLPADLGDRALGCYIKATQRIQLLSYERFEAGGAWFRLPRDRELYRALASHEMAHAVVGAQCDAAGLPVPAHEYVAYVVLFATLEPALRERLLAGFAGTGFASTLEINEINHLVDPSQFGVDAWRHYLKRRDGQVWLRELLAGRVVQTLPVDGP